MGERTILTGSKNKIGVQRSTEESNSMHETSVCRSESVHAIQIIGIEIINRCLSFHLDRFHLSQYRRGSSCQCYFGVCVNESESERPVGRRIMTRHKRTFFFGVVDVDVCASTASHGSSSYRHASQLCMPAVTIITEGSMLLLLLLILFPQCTEETSVYICVSCEE
jgi:hypothetical protein